MAAQFCWQEIRTEYPDFLPICFSFYKCQLKGKIKTQTMTSALPSRTVASYRIPQIKIYG